MEGLKSNQMTDGQGNAIRDYIWMGDIPVGMVDYTGITERVTYLHADHLNTPRYATDETGTLVWQWSSDAFGNGTANEDPDGDGTAITLNLRFPGQYYDAESGLHYNWNRYYDPAIGRYITSDPIGLDGGLNTFGYVGGNPIKWKDPYGLICMWNQSTGHYQCRDNDGNKYTETQPGETPYSGYGPCKNNPACADKSNRGPIPKGCYIVKSIGEEQGDPGLFNKAAPTDYSLELSPIKDNSGLYPPVEAMYEGPVTAESTTTTRHSFWIHGYGHGQAQDGASAGCPIMQSKSRKQIQVNELFCVY